jgi:hypothetical protein
MAAKKKLPPKRPDTSVEGTPRQHRAVDAEKLRKDVKKRKVTRG